MGRSSNVKEHHYEYLGASALAAVINYPLWRASALGQSGFRVTASSLQSTVPAVPGRLVNMLPPSVTQYLHAFAPPYKGMIATIIGMTWARAAIFWGSDRGKEILNDQVPGILSPSFYTLLPPLVLGMGVQCTNQPIVRATITVQNPESDLPNVRAAIRHIYDRHGIAGLWHGTSAGILKTVPKYCTAIVVKNYMESVLPITDPTSLTYESDNLWRSAYKSAAAGVAGAALTNPFDVIRNEMFKTNKNILVTFRALRAELGWKFVMRGMGENLVAVAIPLGTTIFFTDALIQFTTGQNIGN